MREDVCGTAIKTYTIVGGGTAGWVSAAVLAKALEHMDCQIYLVESPHTPTVGVGEATIPSILDLLAYLGISIRDFIARTHATFKLGIKFVDWLEQGTHYWHPFGKIGNDIDGQCFYQHWLKYAMGGGGFDYADFSPAVAMARENRFHISRSDKPNNLSSSSYALHFDAGLAAEYLASYCTQKNVRHIRAHIDSVGLNSHGNIEFIQYDNGERLASDFFLDCSGQQALLIGKAMKVAYQNWQKYLPVDSAVVVQTQCADLLPPYTLSVAHQHGWRWKIPLLNRTANGYVYCSDFCSDEEAQALLLNNIDGDPIAEVRKLQFVTGKRDHLWHKNCLSVGLSSGFVEPLESTAIYLIMRGMLNFVQMLPDKNLHQANIDEYNRLMDAEYCNIRDFIVLHYCLSRREDSDFWCMWKEMQLPQSLSAKLNLFKSYGRLYDNPRCLFSGDSWYAVLEGMKLRPLSYDPIIDASKASLIHAAFPSAVDALSDSAAKVNDHAVFLEQLLLR